MPIQWSKQSQVNSDIKMASLSRRVTVLNKEREPFGLVNKQISNTNFGKAPTAKEIAKANGGTVASNVDIQHMK